MWPEMMHDQELAPEPLTWLIFAVTEAEEGMGELYEDAGDGFGHDQGQFARSAGPLPGDRAGNTT
jgi:hypothetical protein